MGDLLGMVYVCENVTPDENIVKNLKIVDKNSRFFAEFDTHLQSFYKINRNGRQYLTENVWENIEKSEKVQALLADSSWFGEMNHPMPVIAGEKLHNLRLTDIDPANTSHKITKPRLSGKDFLDATIQTDPSTEAGRNFATKIAMGMIPNFSSRAFGDLVSVVNKPTIMMKKLITYDWVFYPSHPDAKKTSTAAFKNCTIMENGNSPDNTITPLHDLVAHIAQNDDNTKAIMESFGLDRRDLVGFTDNGKQIVIRDEHNTIYSNISPKQVKQVKGYLSSLYK